MKRTLLTTTIAVLLGPALSSPTLLAQAPPAAPAAEQAVVMTKPVIKAAAVGQPIELTCATPGTQIRYSIDGSDPGPKGGPYLAPIVLPTGGVIKARAYSEDRKSRSDLAELTVAAPEGKPKLPGTLVPCTQDRDFPTYDWAKRHAALLQIARERKPELVFIGDSITHMFGGEPHDRGQPGKEVWEKYYAKRNPLNLGFGYDFVENTLWRVEHGELDEARAKAVVVMIGTNNMGRNTPEEIAAGVAKLCEVIHAKQGKARIILLGIFPRGPKPDATRAKVAATNELLAKTPGVKYVDFGAKFLEPDGTITREMMDDFLHPTAKGYTIWAEELEPVLKEALGER